MCLVHCVVQTFLRLFFSLKPSKLVQRPLLWGWTCAAAPAIFTVPAPGGAGLNRCGQHVRGTQRSQPRWLFGCSCLMEAEGQLGTVPVTCDTPEEGADGPLHSHIVAHRGYLSGQHQVGLLQRARNCPTPHLCSDMLGILKVELLPGVFASHYRTPAFGVKRVN